MSISFTEVAKSRRLPINYLYHQIVTFPRLVTKDTSFVLVLYVVYTKDYYFMNELQLLYLLYTHYLKRVVSNRA